MQHTCVPILQVPRLMHSVIAALVVQLNGRFKPDQVEGGYEDVAGRQVCVCCVYLLCVCVLCA